MREKQMENLYLLIFSEKTGEFISRFALFKFWSLLSFSDQLYGDVYPYECNIYVIFFADKQCSEIVTYSEAERSKKVRNRGTIIRNDVSRNIYAKKMNEVVSLSAILPLISIANEHFFLSAPFHFK
uniref:Receptor expression-enhancing protein n=1 Tax=Parascaris univalens TaxID=6257 RepID=A0A915BHI9_PARUN